MNRQTGVQRILAAVQRRGFWGVPRIALARVMDYAFDLHYGVQTVSWTVLDALTIASENKQRGVAYQPTLARPLRRVLPYLTPMLPAERILVDFGCGKGRVLLIASEFGFHEVRGVEFSPALCALARHNCAIYGQRTASKTRYQVIEADVVNYPIGEQENVFFMFNPFDAVVIKKVLANIATSLQQHLRKILMVYHYPVHSRLIKEQGCFKKLREFTFWDGDFSVYANA